MKSHIYNALRTFINGCDRSDGLRAIHGYIKSTAPIAMNCDDILRSSIVLSVSSFDLFIHDLFRTEVSSRFILKIPSSTIKIPFNAGFLVGAEQISIIDEQIRLENSYKSFVSPDKLAECLRLLVEKPWDKISTVLCRPSSLCKEQLRNIVDLRNRIAHEGDVNPSFGGVELWPIYPEDVEASVRFLRELGTAIAQVVNDS